MADLQPRDTMHGRGPELSPAFDDIQLTPDEAREIPLEVLPSAGTTEAEVTKAQVAGVVDAVLAGSDTPARDAFEADHPDTIQTWRL